MWWVLHVDLDQFIAAVEVLRHRELKGKPVVVGGDGDPTKRAVVATASYEAREFGVHSGMPMRTAASKCPDAIFLPNDKPVYEAVGDEVVETLRTFPVVVEVLGWDESFIGAHTDDPEALAGGASGTEVTATPWVNKGRSREVTFQTNLTSRAELDEEIKALARRVAEDVAEENRPAHRLGVKVRFAPFITQTRSITLDEPTSDPETLEEAALQVLDMFDHGRPVRLLGVRAEFEG